MLAGQNRDKTLTVNKLDSVGRRRRSIGRSYLPKRVELVRRATICDALVDHMFLVRNEMQTKDSPSSLVCLSKVQRERRTRVEMMRNKNWPSLFLIRNIVKEHISHEERSMNNQERHRHTYRYSFRANLENNSVVDTHEKKQKRK